MRNALVCALSLLGWFSVVAAEGSAAQTHQGVAEAQRRLQGHTDGRRFQDCSLCPRMVVLPRGSFKMGSPAGESGRLESEGPVRVVTINYWLAVGVYEVTFAEWDACVSDGGCEGYRPDDRGWGRGNRPVMDVSWDNAQSYVRWLSNKTRASYRLLSEAEWEYAARAGKVTAYRWGNEIGRNRANCDGCGSRWVWWAEVGSFPANEWGVHDMHGNVWEWVQDCWNDSYRGAPSDGSAWERGDCSKRVIRGGSWFDDPPYLRAANRERINADSKDIYYGFRVARTLGP